MYYCKISPLVQKYMLNFPRNSSKVLRQIINENEERTGLTAPIFLVNTKYLTGVESGGYRAKILRCWDWDLHVEIFGAHVNHGNTCTLYYILRKSHAVSWILNAPLLYKKHVNLLSFREIQSDKIEIINSSLQFVSFKSNQSLFIFQVFD